MDEPWADAFRAYLERLPQDVEVVSRQLIPVPPVPAIQTDPVADSDQLFPVVSFAEPEPEVPASSSALEVDPWVSARLATDADVALVLPEDR